MYSFGEPEEINEHRKIFTQKYSFVIGLLCNYSTNDPIIMLWNHVRTSN